MSDSAGTLTLQNIDVLDSTTESTVESQIDTLANLTSIQGQTVSLSGGLTVSATSTINQDLSTTATAKFSNINITTGNGLLIGQSTPFSDSSGTLTLQNIDSLDSTTESSIESQIDTLANLTSIQGNTITINGSLNVNAASAINQSVVTTSIPTFIGISATSNINISPDNNITKLNFETDSGANDIYLVS